MLKTDKEIIEHLVLICNECKGCANYDVGSAPCESINKAAIRLKAEQIFVDIEENLKNCANCEYSCGVGFFDCQLSKIKRKHLGGK